MSLELAIKENTVAVNALTALLLKGGLSVAGNAGATTEKKVDSAATASAGTGTTAATSAVQEKKVESSVEKPAAMSADERASTVKAAIAKVGRDPVVALLTEFGAKKASEIDADRLPAFDVKLNALAA